MDDKDDVQLYSYEEMADAIVYGITGERVQIVPETDKAEQGEEASTGDNSVSRAGGCVQCQIQCGSTGRKVKKSWL